MAGLTEEEQIEALKQWWSKNGTSTIVGVVLAIAAVVGYQTWRSHEQKRGDAASAVYEQLVEAMNLDDPMKALDKDQKATAKYLAQELKDDYSGSAYASFAAMYLAKLAVEDGDLKTAQQQLEWTLSHGLDDSLKVIVKTRLARVQLARNKPEEALKTLDGVQPDEFRPSYDELKGDIYHAMGDNEKAREAYERAINSLGEGDVRPLLKMKLDQLPPPAAVPSNKSSKAGGKTANTGDSPNKDGKSNGDGSR